MRSKSSNNHSGIANAYNIKQTVSDSFIVHWIFAIDQNYTNIKQIQSIQNIYPKNIRDYDMAKLSFNPLCLDFASFSRCLDTALQVETDTKIEKRGNSSKIIKVVADPVMAEVILLQMEKRGRMQEISQLHLVNRDINTGAAVLKLMEKYKQLVVSVDSLSFFIEVAKAQIQKWRVKFEILRNVMCLQDMNVQDQCFIYRIRVYACIKLDHQKYSHYLNLFKKYLSIELNYRDKLKKQQISQSNLLSITSIIRELNDSINLIRQNKMKEFCQSMFLLYQDDRGIFYQILNSGMKKFGVKDYQWENLMLPVSLMFKAVLYWYRKEENKENITQQFNDGWLTVWRGGKMHKDQLSKIKERAVNQPYYQFYSFTSTTKKIKVAIRKFLLNSDREIAKFNCLFKFKIKKPSFKFDQHQLQFLESSFCQMPSRNKGKDVKEEQILINALTVGRVTNIEQISYYRLLRENKISISELKNADPQQKIPIIDIQIGDFEQNLKNTQFLKTMNKLQFRERRIYQNYIYMLQTLKKYKQFETIDALEMCNETDKAYTNLITQIQEIVAKSLLCDGEEDRKADKINFLYKQQNYYSKLSDLCYKMGKLTEAKLYNELAIEKYNQLQNIDKNRSFFKHQISLDQMFLKSSQYLIENHQFFQASEMLTNRISELQNVEDEKQKQKAKVAIARLYIDLGVANFKQGKLKQAKEIFQNSANTLQSIFSNIDYDCLKKQTFFGGFIVDSIIGNASFFDGPEIYYQRRRSQNIKKLTQVYGGQKKLLDLQTRTKQLQTSVLEALTNHKQMFNDKMQFQTILQQIQSKIDLKLQKEQAMLQDMKLSQEYKNGEGLRKIMEDKKLNNQYDRKREQMKKKMILEQKTNYQEIVCQQLQIQKQKMELEKMRFQFWENPFLFIQDKQENEIQFNQMLLKKKQSYRKYLLLENDKITVQQLTEYYKNSANSINKYIQDLSKLRYSKSAPKVLQQYNQLVQLYLQIDNKDEAVKSIEQVKQYAIVTGQEKYYELSVAYFLKGKIYYGEADIQFMVLQQNIDLTSKIQQINLFRRQSLEKALKQFALADEYLIKALIKKDCEEHRNIYQNDQKRLEIMLWKINCLLIQMDLQPNNKQIYKNVSLMLGNIYQSLKLIQTADKIQIQADYFQAKALFYFKSEKYLQSLKMFRKCLAIRQQRSGKLHWRNIQTYVRIVFLFSLVNSLEEEISEYCQIILKNYTKFKSYSFFWKICLANFYLVRNCESNRYKYAIQFIQNVLIFMQMQGFADEYFYLQYELIFDNEYVPYHNNAKQYLPSNVKLFKKTRQNNNAEKESKVEIFKKQEDTKKNRRNYRLQSSYKKSNLNISNKDVQDNTNSQFQFNLIQKSQIKKNPNTKKQQLNNKTAQKPVKQLQQVLPSPTMLSKYSSQYENSTNYTLEQSSKNSKRTSSIPNRSIYNLSTISKQVPLQRQKSKQKFKMSILQNIKRSESLLPVQNSMTQKRNPNIFVSTFSQSLYKPDRTYIRRRKQ